MDSTLGVEPQSQRGRLLSSNMSWPEQSIALRQGDDEVGTTLGTPFVAKVVRNTAVEVLKYVTIIERTLGPVVATVAMLSNVVV